MPTALLAAPLLLAAVFAMSGIAKLGDVPTARRAMRDLRVPAAFDSDLVARAHPWTEIALAVGLLVLPTPWRGIVAAAALVLLAAYTVLLVGALRRAEDVTCACFGADDEPVSGGTVVRNAVLLLLAVLVGVDCVTGPAPVARLLDLPAADWAWLGMVALGTSVWALIARRGSRPAQNGRRRVTSGGIRDGAVAEGAVVEGAVREGVVVEGDADAGMLDYERTDTPDVSLWAADGTEIRLLEETAVKAHLLVFLSPGCGSCLPLLTQLPTWSTLMPEITVQPVRQAWAGDVPREEPFDSMTGWWDDGSAARALKVPGTPGAVLLGADGQLAGGPVLGYRQVRALLHDVLGELANPIPSG